MAKIEQRVVQLDDDEHDVVVRAVNDMRNDLIEQGQPTGVVDDTLLKVACAPVKKVRIHGVPKKPDDFLGRGRATERASFCPDGAKRAERSLRGRDEAR